jgi:PAS domain S-box-containing protein
VSGRTRVSLRRRLLGGSAALSLVAVLSIGGLLALDGAMHGSLVRETDQLFDDQRTADRVVAGVRGQLFEASRYLTTPRAEFLDAFRTRGDEVYAGLRYYLFRALRVEERVLVERIKERHQRIEVTAQDAFTELRAGRSDAARERTEAMVDLARAMEGDLDRLVGLRLRARDALVAHHARTERQLMVAGGVLAAVLLGCVLAQAGLLRRRVLEPLAELAAAMSRVGRGDGEVRVAIRWDDEIGSVARRFNATAAELQEERARAAAAEARYRDLVEGLDAVVWERDPRTGAFTFVSARAESLLGWPLADWLGDPGFAERELHAPAGSMGDAAAPGGDHTREYAARTADGRTLWLCDQVRVARRVDGAPALLRGVTIDVSARREGAARLAAAEAHYRRLVETSPYAIFALDRRGRVVEANAAMGDLLGRPAASLPGADIAGIVDADQLRVMAAAFRRAIATADGVCEMELQVARSDGETRLLRLRAAAVRARGERVRVHGVAHDITEERAVEAQLRRTERLASVGTLIGGVAHELNNPLSAIKSFAQLLLTEPGAPAPVREGLEVMGREADRAARVVADLRRLSRDTQRLHDARAPVELREVVDHVARLRRYEQETHNVRLETEVDGGLPAVWADRPSLEQLLLNLVVNAEQAMRGMAGERRLSVRVLRGGRGVVLEVADTGPGIAPINQERIFDAFWTTKAPGEGMGLGLSLVHRIVDEHGGTIAVRSDPGHGACFVVELPVCDRADAALPRAPRAAAPGAGRRILVVDDEPTIRSVVSRYLRRRGHTVEEASDGAEALRRVASSPEFDLILTDLRMPGMDGDELFAALRTAGLADRLVFVTGDAVSPDAAAILARTGAPVVHKPFDLDELSRLVEGRAASAA